MTEHKPEQEQSQTDNIIEYRKAIKKKSFRQLFSTEELWHYGIAITIYITLGVFIQNWILNIAGGILFFVVWMWVMPPLADKLRGRTK